MEIVATFMQLIIVGMYLFAPLLIALSLITIVTGQIVGRIESWTHFDALYWSFITATTVGYGDIRPVRRLSKALSVVIAFNGLVFTGIVVAIAVHTASTSLNQHSHIDDVEMCLELLRSDRNQ